MNTKEKIYDNLELSLEKLANEPVNSTNLDHIFKIVGSMYKLCKMIDGDMGQNSYAYDGYSRRGSYANRRDSMGRYSSKQQNSMNPDMGRSNDGYYMGSFDNHYSKEEAKWQLEEIAEHTDDQRMKQMIQKLIGDLSM